MTMRASRKKMINVTCSENIKKKVDDFLTSEYHAWRQIQQPRRDSNNNGLFSCGTQASNTLIMEYVRFIYNQYGISDPLNSNSSLRTVQKQYSDSHNINNHARRGNSLSYGESNKMGQDIRVIVHRQDDSSNNNNNNRRNSNDMRQSKIMEETPVKQLADKYSDTAPKKTLFDSQESTVHKRDNSNYHERRTIDSIDRSQAIKIEESLVQSGHYRIPRGSEQIEQMSSLQILKQDDGSMSNQVYTPKQINNNHKEGSKNFMQFSNKVQSMAGNNTPSKRSTASVSQSYRYCIACEQAVLQANIERHEVNCQQFTKVYQLDLDGILNHLHVKIEKLKQTIKDHSCTLQDDDCQHIRQVCQNMNKESEQVAKTGQMTNRYISSYDEAIKIGKRWALTTEEINKLRWFIKIRQQIKTHFNV